MQSLKIPMVTPKLNGWILTFCKLRTFLNFSLKQEEEEFFF